MRQQARVLVNDLQRNAAHGGSHDGPLLPQRLGYGQSESFPETLLDDDRGRALQRVDLERGGCRELEYVNARIAADSVANLFEHGRSLRIVGRASSGKHELAVEIALHNLEGAYDAKRVFQPVEARDLRDDRPAPIDAELVEHALDEPGGQLAVLVRQRIDRWKEQILGNRQLLSERGGREHGAVE